MGKTSRDVGSRFTAFESQQDWQNKAYEQVAVAIALELDKRGNLHHQIRQLDMGDLTRMAYVAVARYAELREARRVELYLSGGEDEVTDYLGG